MARPAAWLRQQVARRNLTQQVAAGHAGMSGAFLSDILSRGNVPSLNILCRSADYNGGRI